MPKATGTGVMLALVYLVLLGTMPTNSNNLAAMTDALTFAFFLSLWLLAFSLPLLIRELTSHNKEIFAATLPKARKRRIFLIILLTDVIFGASTYLFVLAAEKAGAASATQVTFFCVLISSVFLAEDLAALKGPDGLTTGWTAPGFQLAAMIMGLVYYLQLFFWLNTIRLISVSLASTITVTWPMLLMMMMMMILTVVV